MNKVIKYLTNFIIHATLGSILIFGGAMISVSPPLDSDAGPLFYFGLIIAAIPLLIWGRRVVGRLIRLPWQLLSLFIAGGGLPWRFGPVQLLWGYYCRLQYLRA